jgi:short-subunit dehydrogenase
MEVAIEKALVTGASSGIGRATAIKLAENGFQVIAAARRLDRLKELAEKVQGIIPKQVDLARHEEIEGFCQYLRELSEPVSVLVNNAGFGIRGAIEDLLPEDVRRIFEVNVFALIRVAQACLPGMRRQRKGTIVNISSMVGKHIVPLSGIYASTKHAVEAITDALRIEVRPFGIKVVAIRPGPVATEYLEVAKKLTGDILARTDPDYIPIYERAGGGGAEKTFPNLAVPGPDVIADLILKVVLSDTPKAAYAVGPLVDEFLGQRTRLDDDEFDRFLTEKFGLLGLGI